MTKLHVDTFNTTVSYKLTIRLQSLYVKKNLKELKGFFVHQTWNCILLNRSSLLIEFEENNQHDK